MNKSIKLFILIFFLASLFVGPLNIVYANRPLQSSLTITGFGQICNDQGSCGAFELTFNPEGGEVYGSYSGTFEYTSSIDTLTSVNTSKISGTLTGTFTGGDGGILEGNAEVKNDSNTVTNGVDSQGFAWTINEPDVSTYTAQWNGNLYANGTGSGWVSNFYWTITFDASAFTHENAELPTSNEEVILPTPPMSNQSDNPMDTGDPAWVWNTSITERMHGWVEIDQAIAEMLGQDSALIARDSDGTFYVVDNQGNRKAIPPEIVDALQINDNFALLSNRNLLENNPTVKALIAKEGAGFLNATDGTGDLAFYSPPDWLKQRQYMWLMTQCEQGVCSGYTKISIFKSSGYINMNALASSEHSSVRGTINGGGDFIYEPIPSAVGSFLFSILLPVPISAYPPYLGVLVTDKSDGAEIIKIQPGSPSAGADLIVGDLIADVDGNVIDDQHTLQSVLGQFHGGDEIVLGIIREGKIMSPNLTLAAWIPNVIETPSAWIMVSDQTELVYDIGLNGVTAVYVISDKALVHEPETKTEVEVPAGMALIIVPGEPVGEPFAVSDQDLNTWWKKPSVSDAPSSSTLTKIQGKDFNPIPGVDGETLYWGGWLIIAILYLAIFIVKLVKKP